MDGVIKSASAVDIAFLRAIRTDTTSDTYSLWETEWKNAAKRAEVAFLSRIMELEKEADPNYNPRLVTSNEKRISDL